ncbi:MAG: RNA polymerase subunit sigma-24 [Alphaproteobacteria bacterium CG_4_9_14_3_um_filter_47_13]|nr:MAG: RNA polymerase subunit sigma-24 [Alphaproteobacteria bacterium CG_4_9_14_3_um_filter_47_13]
MAFTHKALTKEISKLQKFALRLCQNRHDAEDLLQNTVLKALEKKDMFEDGTNLFSWTSKIMYNNFVSGYRRKVKFETQYDCEDYIMNQSTEARQDNISELSQVNEAMALISDEHRTVLICICIKGMKYNEVATMLAIPIGTVRSRLSRAREQLQEALIQRAANKIYSSPSSLPAIIQKAA